MSAGIFSPRALLPEERRLLEWLITHAHASAGPLLASVPEMRVVREVRGGSAYALEFAADLNGLGPKSMLAEFVERKSNGEITTVVLLEREGQLCGIEVWAAESERAPSLPAPEGLRAVT